MEIEDCNFAFPSFEYIIARSIFPYIGGADSSEFSAQLILYLRWLRQNNLVCREGCQYQCPLLRLLVTTFLKFIKMSYSQHDYAELMTLAELAGVHAVPGVYR